MAAAGIGSSSSRNISDLRRTRNVTSGAERRGYALVVTFRRPKFVFDAQIVSYVRSEKIPRAEWEGVRSYMSSRARYAISSITLYELLAGIEGGDDAHFHDNRERLRVLYEPARRELLPLAGDFVRSVVFGLPIRSKAFQPNKLKTWIEVILSAQTKKDLKEGRVVLRGNADQSYGSSLAQFADQIRRGKQMDADRLEKLRRKLLLPSTPDTWSREVLKRMDVPSDPANITKLQSSLGAAWRYELSRYELAKDPAYDFAKHDSDWLDGQLLYYLADPVIHFVTSDRRLKNRARGSSQANRILSFDELKAMAAN
jgi:hypothetical protein